MDYFCYFYLFICGFVLFYLSRLLFEVGIISDFKGLKVIKIRIWNRKLKSEIGEYSKVGNV